MASRSRMPPPSWIAVLSPTAAIMSRITFSFFGRPAIAPFRSTMCRRFAPCADQCFAMATGSSENTVAVLMSPCFRRTQRPSFRSMAGMMSTGLEDSSGSPPHEIRQKLQAGRLAFFGVELDRKNIIPGNGAGKGLAMDGGRGGESRIARLGIVAVHEVEPAAVGDPFPERMRPHLGHFVPAHMRNLQPRRPEPRHLSGEHTEAPCVTFLAVLEQHLQADADAEKGLAAGCLDDRFTRTAIRELAHAVAHGALPGDHHPVRGDDPLRIRGHQNFGIRRDMLDRLRHRAQISHAVIDDGDFQTQSEPLVEGTTPAARGSGSAAIRSERANALNTVSHWWCALSPRRLSMCSVTCAWLTKPWKNSCTRSTSNSPISARVNLTWYSSPGRPEKSSTTRESASSRGT